MPEQRNSNGRLRLVPPPRDLKAESRDALRRFRESVDLEDEPTQPEIHFHFDEIARAREQAALVPANKHSSDPPPLRKSVGKMILAATAALGAIGALAEAIRQLLTISH